MSSSTSTSKWKDAGLRVMGAAVAALVLLVALEALLRVLPTPRGLHRANPETPSASARFERNHDYTFSLGWDLRHVVHGRSNGMGFLSPHEYRNGPHAVALIGDSFAEGEMLAFEESLAGQLEAKARGKIETFNFGLSGAALPHYLGMAREMGGRFQFDAAVVVIVEGDYVEGFGAEDGLYKWSSDPEQDVVKLVPTEQRSKLKQLVRESAFLHYLRGNLKFSPSSLMPHSGGNASCVPQQLGEKERERLARYVDALPEALHLDPGRIVLVFQANTKEIYARVDHQRHAAATDCLGLDALALAELRKLAAAKGLQTVEVGPLLEGYYRSCRRPLDFRPMDPHWNGIAVSVIAGEIARRLGWINAPQLAAKQ